MLVIGGVVWAAALLGSVAAGPVAVAVVTTPVALIAVLTAWRATVPRMPGPGGLAVRPGLPTGPQLWALVALGLTPLFALAGIVGVVVVAVAGVAVTARWSAEDGTRPGPACLVAVVAPAIATGFLVLACRQGTELVVVMVLAVLAFDMANSLMGRSPSGGLLGAVSGAITVLVFSIVVNALLDPPFTGASSWLLCLLAAVLAPLGVLLCGRLVRGRVPAVRRLDSLVMVAPMWWTGVVVLLHR